MAIANSSTKYSHVSRMSVGSSAGNGLIKLNEVVQSGAQAATITGATTLTAASNQLQILDAAGGATVTLPALADGLRFEFVVGALFATTPWIIASAEGDNINGYVHNIADGAIVAAAEDQVNLVESAESLGDTYVFTADSGNSQWIASGLSVTTGATTVTDPA
jgi:hypothetical protein